MKYLKILVLICLFNSQLGAQSLHISGKVLSEKQPLAFASVGISALGKGTTTNQNGEFLLENLPAGRFLLEVRMIGFSNFSVWVQTEKSNKPLLVNLEALNQSLKEVTISGTLSETSRSSSPIAVEVINSKFFQKNPTNNLFESIQMVNGVLPTMNCNVCNTGDIQINGLDGPYTLVLIDGMPIVSALSAVYGLMGIPNSMIEKVEIVKGPAATLYGSEAVGGLINIITKNANTAPKLSIDYFGTSYLEQNLDVGFSVKKEKLSYLFSANLFGLNQKVDLNKDNFTDIALQKRASVFAKMHWQRSNSLASQVSLRLFKENRFGGEMNWTEDFRGGDSIYGESIFTDRLELIGLHPFKLFNQHVRFQLSFNLHNQDAAYGTSLYLGKQTTGFGQLLYNKNIGSRHRLLFGTALRYTFYDDNSVATTNGFGLNQPDITYLPGVFVQDEIQLDAYQSLLIGLRMDFNARHGFIYSPRINYKIGEWRGHTFRMGVGNGFRIVNLFTEDHAALTGARKLIIKEDLEPEKSWNVNLQYSKWKGFDKGFLDFDASVFYTYFSNKIIPDYDTDPNAIIYTNINEHAVSKGISLNLNAQFAQPLKLNAGVTFMRVYSIVSNQSGELVKSNQIHAPNFSGVFGVSYKFKRFYNITVDYTGQVYGPMRLPVLPNDFRPEYSPWYTLQNIQFIKNFDRRLEIYAGIKNVFNFLPKDPIMRWFDPFDKNVNDPISNPNNFTFDPTYNYAPMMARRYFVGIRYNLR